MRCLSLVGTALVLTSCPLSAQPYRVMDISREAIQAIDEGAIARTGDSARVWLFTNYWQAQPFGSKTMTRAKSLVEIDCSNHRMRLQATHFFQDRDTPLPSGDDKLTPWSAIIPDAWVMKVRNAVCDGSYGTMGAMKWEDYEEMVSINREVARRAFPTLGD